MHIYYRVSDSSYQKPKLIGATKEVCFMNFCSAFHESIFNTPSWSSAPPPDDYVPPMSIIADRCERTTVKMLMNSGIPVTITDLGNAGSILKAIELAIEISDPDELIYFCEDDYLHLFHIAPKLLQEGIKRADYVTLYDHPDKYTRFYNGGEFSKVIKAESSHWRFTISTCMTFGAKVKTLKEDWGVFQQHCSGLHPHDHKIFTDLGKKGRRLIVPIPGAACHTDLTFSGEINQILIEPWAIELMINQLEFDLSEPKGTYPRNVLEAKLQQKVGWERLATLEDLKSSL